jgi:hypothetical protein
MPTLIATPGASNANSYATVTEADAYHDENLRVTAWSGAVIDDKVRALIMATRLLDAYVEWYGTKLTEAQALAHPLTLDQSVLNGELFVSSTIPTFLKRATAEFAKFLLEKDRIADPATLGIKAVGAGPAQVTFDSFGQAEVIPLVVQRMIQDYGEVSSAFQGRVERA